MFFNKSNTTVLVSDDLTCTDVREVELELITGKHNLLINSPGGNINAMLYGMACIRNRKITTIGQDEVASAALSIFLLGHHRIALPNSSFMFHQATAKYEGRAVAAGEMQQLARIAKLTGLYNGGRQLSLVHQVLLRIDTITVDTISSTTKLERQKVVELMQGDGLTFSAEESLFYGFVHKIIPGSAVML